MPPYWPGPATCSRISDFAQISRRESCRTLPSGSGQSPAGDDGAVGQDRQPEMPAAQPPMATEPLIPVPVSRPHLRCHRVAGDDLDAGSGGGKNRLIYFPDPPGSIIRSTRPAPRPEGTSREKPNLCAPSDAQSPIISPNRSVFIAERVAFTVTVSPASTRQEIALAGSGETALPPDCIMDLLRPLDADLDSFNAESGESRRFFSSTRVPLVRR